MRVSDVLTKGRIIPELDAREKHGVLDELSSHLARTVDGLDKGKLLELLLERERLGSTGIGHGVAIPHAKIKGIDEVVVSFGRSKKGVDFASMDSKPVHLFFLIVAPENSTVAHLKMLAGVSQILKDNGLRERLVWASDEDDIYRMIVEEEKRVQKGAVI
ncbi:MAG: PTS sugar transporter subunit IIA [Deltaproteobacteria bacterium]|nr:PTS sugar transporter subunit IIA [Deltaproteobacteria bacterium]